MVFDPSALPSPSRPWSSFSANVGCTFPDITLRFLLLNQFKKVLCQFTIGKDLCLTWNEQTTKFKVGAGAEKQKSQVAGNFSRSSSLWPNFSLTSWKSRLSPKDAVFCKVEEMWSLELCFFIFLDVKIAHKSNMHYNTQSFWLKN